MAMAVQALLGTSGLPVSVSINHVAIQNGSNKTTPMFRPGHGRGAGWTFSLMPSMESRLTTELYLVPERPECLSN